MNPIKTGGKCYQVPNGVNSRVLSLYSISNTLIVIVKRHEHIIGQHQQHESHKEQG